jgi:hypothetical protein
MIRLCQYTRACHHVKARLVGFGMMNMNSESAGEANGRPRPKFLPFVL